MHNRETEHFKMGNISAGENEFESLYLSQEDSSLIILCKDCVEDSKKTLTAYSFNKSDSANTFQKYKVFDIATLHQKLGIEKRLHPSAAAINPITKDLYIVSSIQKLLVILNSNGAFKSFYKLNPALYKQPEDIRGKRLKEYYENIFSRRSQNCYRFQTFAHTQQW